MNLETILESYFNGQKKQFIEQVKAYGIDKFSFELKFEKLNPELKIEMLILIINRLK